MSAATPERSSRPAAKKQGSLQNPKGGLTAKGREYFRKKQGAHLKPGVTKALRDMSPQDKHRKGSWAVRFYGRKGALPPLQKPDGTPTRYALTAAAWGEPIPTTVAAARRIAAKGKRLLAAYARSRAIAR